MTATRLILLFLLNSYRSVFAFVWERWGEPWKEAQDVAKRQRQRNHGERFDEDTNVDDLFRY